MELLLRDRHRSVAAQKVPKGLPTDFYLHLEGQMATAQLGLQESFTDILDYLAVIDARAKSANEKMLFNCRSKTRAGYLSRNDPVAN